MRRASAVALIDCRLFSDCIRRQSEHKRKALKRRLILDAGFDRLAGEHLFKNCRLSVPSSQHYRCLEKSLLKLMHQRHADQFSSRREPITQTIHQVVRRRQIQDGLDVQVLLDAFSNLYVLCFPLGRALVLQSEGYLRSPQATFTTAS